MEASHFVVAGWRVETCFGYKLVTRLFRTYFHPTLVFALHRFAGGANTDHNLLGSCRGLACGCWLVAAAAETWRYWQTGGEGEGCVVAVSVHTQ